MPKQLDPQLIESMREHRRRTGDTYSKIAAMFGVSRITVVRYCKDVDAPMRERIPSPTKSSYEERFRSRVAKRASDQCWPWTGAVNPDGYGYMWMNRRSHPAHRIAYQVAKGAIPEKHDIHHQCGNRRCCNPDHLVAVTRRKHMELTGILCKVPNGVTASSASNIAYQTAVNGEGSVDTAAHIDTEPRDITICAETEHSPHINVERINRSTVDTSELLISNQEPDSPVQSPQIRTTPLQRPNVTSVQESERVSIKADDRACNLVQRPCCTNESAGSDDYAPTSSVKTPRFAPAAILLNNRRTNAHNHVVVGQEPAQIRFLEQQLNTKAIRVDRVNDDLLSGVKGQLYQVYAPHCVDLSPELRSRTALWSADPLHKGSSTLHAVVKFAATLVPTKKPPTKDTIQLIESILDHDKIEDIRGLIWKAVALFHSDPKPPKRWINPWEGPATWFCDIENPGQRLRTLYNLLTNYIYFLQHGEEGLKAMQVRPSEAQKIKNLNLDPTRTYATYSLLSQWTQGRLDDYVCALRISCAWS